MKIRFLQNTFKGEGLYNMLYGFMMLKGWVFTFFLLGVMRWWSFALMVYKMIELITDIFW